MNRFHRILLATAGMIALSVGIGMLIYDNRPPETISVSAIEQGDIPDRKHVAIRDFNVVEKDVVVMTDQDNVLAQNDYHAIYFPILSRGKESSTLDELLFDETQPVKIRPRPYRVIVKSKRFQDVWSTKRHIDSVAVIEGKLIPTKSLPVDEYNALAGQIPSIGLTETWILLDRKEPPTWIWGLLVLVGIGLTGYAWQKTPRREVKYQYEFLSEKETGELSVPKADEWADYRGNST